MYVGNHGADIPRAVRRLAVRRILDAVQVVHDRLVEVHGVTLVERVDFASGWNLDLCRPGVRGLHVSMGKEV